ncbi:MAG: tetratricopeptide repeat protein [Bacteroidales bacterium]|nr:tetratricopeptide repeat protein [Bacteroidales bacterium]
MAKQNTKQGDERLENVEEALSKTELWIENNQKTLWIILIAVLLVAVAIWGYSRYRDRKNQTAQDLSFPSEMSFEEKATQAVDFATYYMQNEDYAQALNGDGENVGFLSVVNDYGSSKAGNLAAYYAGICYLKQGDYQNAIEYLKKYSNNDKVFAPLALGLIADCYLELGDQQNAVSYYEKAAAKNANDFTSPMHLMKLGMTYEIMGNYAKALETYKTLKKDFPNSNEAFEISKSIAYLEEKMK